MQSSFVAAGMDALSDPAKTFDTSGKSPVPIHHPAILKSPMALPDGLFGAIAGKKFLRTIEVALARARRMIARALPNRARLPCASPREIST
jgi:hypothetical protein